MRGNSPSWPRSAARPRTATIDLKGTHNGQDVPGLAVNDFLYLGLRQRHRAARAGRPGGPAGDVPAFDADFPDGPVALKLLVKDVKEKVCLRSPTSGAARIFRV